MELSHWAGEENLHADRAAPGVVVRNPAAGRSADAPHGSVTLFRGSMRSGRTPGHRGGRRLSRPRSNLRGRPTNLLGCRCPVNFRGENSLGSGCPLNFCSGMRPWKAQIHWAAVAPRISGSRPQIPTSKFIGQRLPREFRRGHFVGQRLPNGFPGDTEPRRPASSGEGIGSLACGGRRIRITRDLSVDTRTDTGCHGRTRMWRAAPGYEGPVAV